MKLGIKSPFKLMLLTCPNELFFILYIVRAFRECVRSFLLVLFHFFSLFIFLYLGGLLHNFNLKWCKTYVLLMERMGDGRC